MVVNVPGTLAAMAGERMRFPGYTEVSGVCTHPDFRGRGYAARLMCEVGRDILSRGETPFLHAFADNVGAIGLYEKLGFVSCGGLTQHQGTLASVAAVAPPPSMAPTGKAGSST